MRTYRDAKAMATTLRQDLAARSIAISHSDGLELIARAFGCKDWNTLSAIIQGSEVRAPRPAREIAEPVARGDGTDGADTSGSSELTLDAAILDAYAGFYRISETSILTVVRDGDHLNTRATGQGWIPIFARNRTQFFAKAIDAQVTFLVEPGRPPTSLILHGRGGDVAMGRIDPAAARRIEDDVADRLRRQTRDPRCEAALLRLISGLTSGSPVYDEMSPGLREATRQQLPQLRADHEELGTLVDVRFLGITRQGADAFVATHRNGASHWRVRLDRVGLIDAAWVTPWP